MRDGRHVGAPRQDPRISFMDERQGLEAIRYYDHNKTCPVPSLRTFAGGAAMPYTRGVFGSSGRSSPSVDDPVREARRATLLQVDRPRDLDS